MNKTHEAKLEAARRALDEVPDEGVVGLGSGSTARIFVEQLAPLVRAGRAGGVTCVPTSESTRALAASLGIPLLGDDGPWDIDVNVDGADEVSDTLDLIKGGGGAHAREKVVNYAAKRNVIIVDSSKMSARLGEKRAVPVEVLPFAHLTTRRRLERFGRVDLRTRDGEAWRTDAGNLLYDVATGPIAEPAHLDRELRAIPGVVETGLFVGRADVVIVADESGGVREIVPPR